MQKRLAAREFRFPLRRATARHYLYALVLVAFALPARLAIGPVEGGIQYVTFFPAVALTAILGGLWPGIMAALLGMMLASFCFWSPFYAFSFEFRGEMLVANLVFLFDGILVCTAIEATHRYYHRVAGMVAERTRMELSLRRNEEWFRQVFDASGDAIFVIDLRHDGTLGRIVEVNETACRRLGYSRAELLRMTPDDINAPEHGTARDPQFLQKLKADGQIRIERVHIARDGRHIPVEINVHLVSLGGKEAVLGVARDVTERKQAEAEQQSILRTTADGFWIVSALDGRVLEVNPAACEMTGYTPDELLSMRISDIDALETPEETRRHMADIMNEQRGRFETRHRRKDGSIMDVEISCRYVNARGGVMVVFVRDISERKRAEAALVAAKAAADVAARTKTAFLANMSHEMRTPLHVITGLGHLLRRDAKGEVERQRLDELCATSDHLLAIIDDVLDLSKIEAQQLELNEDDFRLDEVVDKVMRMIDERARAKGLALAAEIEPALAAMALHGDALRLAQVLINLCGNAIKFTDRGLVRLRIAPRVVAADRVSLRFSVEDGGIGIAPEDQARLFLPFTQVDSSPTRSRGGTGLGLAISQRMVKMMGGSIEIDSRLGVGSVFRFDLTFPRAQRTISRHPAPAVPAHTHFTGRRVLLVEDHPQSQEILLEMLEEMGCEVDVAPDGAEAVACARERRYDVVLMDMQMPRMDGLQATRALRALPAHGQTIVVALTANAFAEDRQRCLEAGMNGHISKPVTPTALAAALSRWLPPLAGAVREKTIADTELSRAISRIPGLEVGPGWLRSPDHVESYRAQLERFSAQHGEDMLRLRESLAAGATEAAHAIAHRLKGIAGLLDAKRVASLADRIARGIGAGARREDVLRDVDQCEVELAELAGAIRVLPQPEPEPAV
ncbi:MAG TPA: PAS domain S-box protein [Rhodocyclaceae bacterium]